MFEYQVRSRKLKNGILMKDEKPSVWKSFKQMDAFSRLIKVKMTHNWVHRVKTTRNNQARLKACPIPQSFMV